MTAAAAFPKFTARLRRILAARDTGEGWKNLTRSERRRARELEADGLFCFAVGNERGKDIALRIANHLLKTIIKEVR